MKFIIETGNDNHTEVDLIMIATVLLAVITISVGLGYFFTKQAVRSPLVTNEQLAIVMAEPIQEITTVREKAQQRLDAYSAYLASMQARLVRLDAVGQRLTTLSGISDEFDFSEEVGLGGEEDMLSDNSDREAFTPPTFMQALDKLSSKIATREKQLEVLEHLLAKQNLRKENYIAGQPVAYGYISSPFGTRIDPINGRIKGHKGIDLAAPRGSKIKAVASGIVMFSGTKTGYGNVVEIAHLDGYKTVYAHNQQNLVMPGASVKAGQVIAKVGSSGRSTGPHVHFEVVKDNRPINPVDYMNRTNETYVSPIQMASVE